MQTFSQAFADSRSFIGILAGTILPFVIVAAVCGGVAIAWSEIYRRIRQNRPHP
jgi:hypothetical protein